MVNDPMLPKTGGNTELFGINDEGVIVGGSDMRGLVLNGSKVHTFPEAVVGLNNHGDLLQQWFLLRRAVRFTGLRL